MKVSELRKFAEYETIYLSDCMDGRIVASSSYGLDKYNDCVVYGIRLQLDVGREKDYARPIIVGWILHSDVKKVRENKC